MTARTIAVFGQTGTQYAPLIAEHLAAFDIEVHCWSGKGQTTKLASDDMVARDALIAQAEAAVISPDFLLTPGNFAALIRGKNLKLIAQPWVGVDWIDPMQLPNGLIYCNAGGHAAPIAEYVLCTILEHTLSLQQADHDLRNGRWYRSGRNNNADARHDDVANKRLGIIGYGEIGTAIATRAVAFDIEVAAIVRTPRTPPTPLTWLGGRDELPRLLKTSDFLVIACDLNTETQDLIDTKAFDLMPPHAFLVNVARGEIVNEDALYDALCTKKIAAAAIDTWYRYPNNVVTPEPDPERGGVFQGSRHDFNALDNMLITPHCAAHTHGADLGRYISLAETLAAYLSGQTMRRHVITGGGHKNTILTENAKIRGHGKIR